VKDKVFFFDLEDDEDYRKAVERTKMVIDHWKNADFRGIQDGKIKIRVNELIFYYKIGMHSENVMKFRQEVFQSSKGWKKQL
jgi:beta-galactosidase beta subunit